MALLPKVKLKTVVSFPAAVYGGTGIAVRKESGQFYFDLNFAAFAPPVGAIPDAANQNALIWNKVTGSYVLAPVSLFGSGASVPMPAYTFKGNATAGAATPTDVDIGGLTAKAVPVGTDEVMIRDNAASGAWKRSPLSALGGGGGVSSIAGNTGAFTLAYPLGNVVNDIRFVGPAKSGYFTFISATSVQMQPRDGDLIKINGVVYQIPGGSISAANTGVFVNGTGASNLAASTLYYAYLFNNAGTLTVDFSSTAYAVSTTAGNVGTIIKSADDTRSLIGMVFTNGSSQFVLEDVISWFNKKSRQVAATGAATSGTAAQVGFSTWSDEAISFHLSAVMTNSTANGAFSTRLVLDGAATGISPRNDNLSAGGLSSVAVSGTKLLGAGHHTVAQSIGTSGTPSGGVEETYVMFRG